MNARRDPDLLIKAFLEDGVNELPDRSYDAVRAATEQTRQWVVVSPWREQRMTRFAIFAAAAAVIVLAAVVGLRFIQADSGVGVGGQPTPSRTPSQSAAGTPTLSVTPLQSPTATPSPSSTSPAPTPSAESVLPPLTEQYTSSMHGITVSYPAGWMVRPATSPWVGPQPNVLSPSADVIRSSSSAFIGLTSQPLGDRTDEQWINNFRSTNFQNCGPTQPHTVAGVEGVITYCRPEGLHALVITEGRAFVVWLYSSASFRSKIEDRAYFEQILATVQLDPTAARN